MNSAICGGLRGVSDTMAAALWGTDILFGLAGSVAGSSIVTTTSCSASKIALSAALAAAEGVSAHIAPLASRSSALT